MFGPVNNASTLWVPVKVPAGKAALRDFMHNWKEGQMQGAPFNGEINLPSEDPERKIRIDENKISHCITEIDENSFDPAKNTVMARVRFCGPYGAEAREKYIKKDLRFITRTVGVKHKTTGERKDAIVTVDCVTRPTDSKLVDDCRTYLDSVKAKRG